MLNLCGRVLVCLKPLICSFLEFLAVSFVLFIVRVMICNWNLFVLYMWSRWKWRTTWTTPNVFGAGHSSMNCLDWSWHSTQDWISLQSCITFHYISSGGPLPLRLILMCNCLVYSNGMCFFFAGWRRCFFDDKKDNGPDVDEWRRRRESIPSFTTLYPTCSSTVAPPWPSSEKVVSSHNSFLFGFTSQMI